MERIKRVANTNYTTISNFVLKDNRLSLKAKGFLTTIFALPEDWDFSINGMVSIVKEGKSSIYSVISELKEMGYCVITQPKDEKGRFSDTTYSFYEMPQTETPLMDCPLTDFPETDNPHTENQPQLNKDINKLLNKVNTKTSLENSLLECEKVVELYHSILPMLPKIKKLNKWRCNKIVVRLGEMDDGIRTMQDVFEKIALSPFLTGKNERKWCADLDWVIKNDSNWVKVMEGKYDEKNARDVFKIGNPVNNIEIEEV